MSKNLTLFRLNSDYFVILRYKTYCRKIAVFYKWKTQTDQWKKAFKNSFPVNYCDKLIKITLVRYTIRLTCSNKQGERNHLVYCNIANYHLNKNVCFVILASMEQAMRVWRKQSFLKESINHFSGYYFFPGNMSLPL